MAVHLRFTGINWDQNQHLHPDERFLTMVALNLSWPDSITQYFDTAESPANPHNRGNSFFVYGTYPVLLVKAVSEISKQYNYSGLTLVGRAVSAVFDLLTCLIVFLITRRLFDRYITAWLALIFYAISVLPIQLSHFFAADTFMVFFLMLSYYFLIRFFQRASQKMIILVGISFGLAFSAKASAAILLPIIALFFLVLLFRKTKFSHLVINGLGFILSAFITIRVAYPYLFNGIVNLNPKLLANWAEMTRLSQPDFYFPPGVQWVHIVPGLFPLQNLVWWGLGLPLAAVSLCAFIIYLIKFRTSFLPLSLAVFIIGVYTYQSFQFAQPLRYFYPIYPVLAVISGWFAARLPRLVVICVVSAALIYPLSFMWIYQQPHTRVAASAWLYRNLPAGSVVSCEYWDDCLPVPLGSYTAAPYTINTLSLYDPDTPQKWHTMSDKISQLDYIIMSSNRLYGSISTAPEHYPQTARYYQSLFSGRLGFTRVAQFASRPALPFPAKFCINPNYFSYGRVSADPSDCDYTGIIFVDDYADETFTVYDHPKVTVFKNVKHLSPGQIYSMITTD